MSFFVSLSMTIKAGFIGGIAIFLLFILFKGSISSDKSQLIFTLTFILLELIIIGSVAIRKRKNRGINKK
ncbi:hypothetical protein QWY93_10120 [Echinicola jeungdonensis]|uniref:Uncharacterized protein n=1 Tax=Echinicola jeungdonensis TaxID=709343 RepID=A0ABV5J9M5_9BACT|nr:hypothetical protein [Echinicola jeungdonensis]MDN3669679.1 hypothetical protein [Echinicola jeungdonensis]